MRRLLTPLLFFVFSGAIGQSIVSGTVSDKGTTEPIPFVYVFDETNKRGTLTNELGQYELPVSQFPTTLTFYHVGYKRIDLRVNSSLKAIDMELETAFLLDSVQVRARDQTSLFKILNQSFHRLRSQLSKSRSAKAFYRQTSKNGSVHNELFEIFYDLSFNQSGIRDWELTAGRYALAGEVKDGFVYNKNFTLINRILRVFKPDVEYFALPIQENPEEYFDLKVSKIINEDDGQILVMDFWPAEERDLGFSVLRGQLYIDINTYDVIRMKGVFDDDNFRMVTFNAVQGDIKEYELGVDISFKRSEDQLLLDYISVNQQFDVHESADKIVPVRTKSTLVCYEYPDKKLDLATRYNNAGDRENIEAINYDKQFWENNPIVKRTPVEKEVIADFERNRKFGSIYFNNKNQVSFLANLENDPLVKLLKNKFSSALTQQEKVYLHTDKEAYLVGDILWFKGYILEAGNHALTDSSRVLYVDLISPLDEVIETRVVRIDEMGQTSGEFDIQPDYQSGTYTLRAYTRRMTAFDNAFFFRKDIEIVTNIQPSIELKEELELRCQFFPEGGDMVQGLSSQLAFEITDQYGNPLAARGTILDNEGQQVTVFASDQSGRGSLFFTPKEDKKFTAKVEFQGYEAGFELPEILASGYVLRVSNRVDKNLNARVLASLDNEGKELYLIGHTRGNVVYQSKGVVTNRILDFEIPRNRIPGGILHLTLMDSSMRLFGERLTYVHSELNHLRSDVKLNRRKLSKRDQIKLDIKVEDDLGNPVVADFSVSVTDKSKVSVDKRLAMASYALINSDVPNVDARIQNLLENYDRENQRNIDLIMLTNGWRRFTWQGLMDDGDITNHEKGLKICGSVGKSAIRKFAGKEITLVHFKESGYYTSMIAEDGSFCFDGVDISGSSEIYLEIEGEDRSEKLALQLNSVELPSVGLSPKKRLRAKTKNIPLLSDTTFITLSSDFQLLEEVTVESSTLDDAPSESREFAPARQVIRNVERYSSVTSALRKQIPFFRVVDEGNAQSTIRFGGRGTSGNPLVLLNGLNVSDQVDPVRIFGNEELQTQTLRNPLMDLLKSIPTDEIDRIEVLYGPEAAFYGRYSTNGVIAIYTKNDLSSVSVGINTYLYDGYFASRQFYSPDYSVEKNIAQDSRTTLFWSPNIRTNENGKAQVSFYNTDVTEAIDIVLEGTSGDGRFISKTVEFVPD